MVPHALAVALWLAAPSWADTGANDLCHAAGQGSGCIGSVSISSERPQEQREPRCDEECRRQAAEDRAYALDNMFHPPRVSWVDSFAMRLTRAIEKRREYYKEMRVEQASCAAVAGMTLPLEEGALVITAPEWLPVVAGVAVTVGAALALAKVVEWVTEEDCPEQVATAGTDPCADVREDWCDDESDCNELRKKTETARNCLARRLAELKECGMSQGSDAPRARYQTAYGGPESGCFGKFRNAQMSFRVDDLCKDPNGRSCERLYVPADCDQIRTYVDANVACLAARDAITKQCFDGASDRRKHPTEYQNSVNALANCATKAEQCKDLQK